MQQQLCKAGAVLSMKTQKSKRALDGGHSLAECIWMRMIACDRHIHPLPKPQLMNVISAKDFIQG